MKRRDFLKSTAAVAGAGMVSAPAIFSPAKAQSRQETLLIVSESGPNNIDIHGVGTNVPGYEVSWNCYDRLISHEMKTGANGVPYYDRDKFKMELAEDMNVGDMSATFKLKKNATFQDGTPVTAKDVKWSLDRAVTVGGFPTFQMGAGSLTKPEQFVVVDDNTFRVDFPRKDRLTIPDLAVIVPAIYNSELVKKNATEKDPWGMEYTKQNTAGSGAYRVVSWNAGTEVIMERNDKWVGGPLPKIKRIVWRMVPSAGNRRALLERGDADISYDLPNKDFVELKGHAQARHHLDAVLERHPVPRHERHQAAVRQPQGPAGGRLRRSLSEDHGRRAVRPVEADVRRGGRRADRGRLAAADQVQHRYRQGQSSSWRRPAIPNGFETTLSFDLGFATVNEPLCVLTQESLAQIGIKTTINKIPGATWRTELNKKVMPLYTNVFSGWLDYPGILLHLVLSRQEFDLQHDELPVEDDGWLHRWRGHRGGRTATRPAYDTDVKGFVDTAFADMPRIPLFQPYSTSRCRRTSPATSTGSTAGSTIGRSRRGRGLKRARHACAIADRRTALASLTVVCGVPRRRLRRRAVWFDTRMAGPEMPKPRASLVRPWRPKCECAAT